MDVTHQPRGYHHRLPDDGSHAVLVVTVPLKELLHVVYLATRKGDHDLIGDGVHRDDPMVVE